MSKNIEPKLQKIENYLKLNDNAIFVIPEYQRAYSWTIERCDKLWQDINDYIKNNEIDPYFFGTIIINCEADDTRLELIDGQQRTTTFLLLLKALLISINDAIVAINDEESTSLLSGLRDRRKKIMSILYRIDADDVQDKPNETLDRDIYNRPILIENNSINEEYASDLNAILKSSNYTEAEKSVKKISRKKKDNKYTNFFKNFKFFYEKIDEMKHDSSINDFTKSLLGKCEIIEIKSWQVAQAITMFNSLNSDGQPLNDSDIISSKLYAMAQKTSISDEFSKLWKELKQTTTNLDNKGIVNLDSLLMQHMYYVRTVNGDTLNDQQHIDVTTPGLRRYFTEINTDLLKEPIALCKELLNLALIWKKIILYPSVQVLFKFSDNFKLFLASYLYRFDEKDVTEDIIQPIADAFLRLFSVLELVDYGFSSKYFKTFLFEEEIKLINKSIDVNEIISDIDLHIKKNWNEVDISDRIKEYEKNSLVYLNEYIFAKENALSFNLNTTYDIEHIMPQSGRNKSEIQKDALLGDEEEFNIYVNKIGNKIVLEESVNRGIGNDWFRSKISEKVIDKKGYVDSKFPIAIKLVEHYSKAENSKPYWTKNDINDATDKACTRICNFIFNK